MCACAHAHGGTPVIGVVVHMHIHYCLYVFWCVRCCHLRHVNVCSCLFAAFLFCRTGTGTGSAYDRWSLLLQQYAQLDVFVTCMQLSLHSPLEQCTTSLLYLVHMTLFNLMIVAVAVCKQSTALPLQG